MISEMYGLCPMCEEVPADREDGLCSHCAEMYRLFEDDTDLNDENIDYLINLLD